MRFDREVKLAARLKHPSIVTVHESARTPMGTSYIVLELVEGIPVDKYAADLRERGDLRAIVRLFSTIADAIRYAHQRGVIHRDLKPGNILVDAKGVPHVLDFGIAKAFDEESKAEHATTRTGEFVGTLAYAAPEQLSSDPDLIDVRIDVYALGVMLYEALTGERPIQGAGALAELITRITTERPRNPSELNPRVDRDLETIVLTALAKNPRERYQTAGDLRDDLERWLEGRAISARAHDFWYLARKAVVRYRLAASVAATFLLLIIAFATTATVLSLQVKRENTSLNQSVSGLVGALEGIDRETSTESVASLGDFLVSLLRNIESNVENRPDVEAPLRDAVGSAYLFQGRYAEAERELLAAQKMREQMFTPPHPALAASLHNLGRLRYKQGRFSEAEAYYRQALEMRVALFGLDHDDVARTSHHLALTLQELGKMSEAERYWQQALQIRRRILPASDPQIANTLSGLATFEIAVGDYAEARRTLGQVLEAVETNPRLGPLSLPAGRVLHNLGLVLTNLGEYEQGYETLERSLAIKQRVEPNSEQYAKTLAELGRNRLLEGSDLALARRQVGESLSIRRAHQASGEQLCESLRLLALIALAEGNAEEASDLIEQAGQALARSSRPEDHWDYALLYAARARVLAALDDLDHALAEAERADAIMSRQRSDADPDLCRNLDVLISLYEQLGRDDLLRSARMRRDAIGSAPASQPDQPE